MVQMREETKDLVRKSVEVSKGVFRWGFVPLVIWLGMPRVVWLYESRGMPPSIQWQIFLRRKMRGASLEFCGSCRVLTGSAL